MKRILQLCTFNPDSMNSGGKIRAFQIKNSLREAFHVETLSFLWGKEKPPEEMHFTLDEEHFLKIGGNSLIGDFGIASYLLSRPETMKHVIHSAMNFMPDAILLEQPYLLFLHKEIEIQSGRHIPLIYSSHNVEEHMKGEIYKRAFNAEGANRFLNIVRSLEGESIKRCQVSLSVSTEDRDWIDNIRGKKESLLIPNGHWRPKENERSAFWKELLGRTPDRVNWLFVGSAHPPNIEGMNSVLSALPPESNRWRLIVAGSVSVPLARWKERVKGLALISNPSNDDIDALLTECHGVLLPIWSGGGSNLKTAQALLAEKPIIGTQYAFRGFESYTKGNEIHIRETAKEFAETLMNHKPRGKIQRSDIEMLTWDHILKELPSKIEELVWSSGGRNK